MTDVGGVVKDISAIMGIGGGGIGGIAGLRLLWTYFKDQRKFVTKDECKERIGSCSKTVGLQKEFDVHKVKMEIIVEQHSVILKDIQSEVKTMARGMADVSKSVAVMAAVMEAKAHLLTPGEKG